MEVYRTEEEQIEAIKRFFNNYGLKLAVVIVACVASFFAYQYWNQSKAQHIEKASIYYNELNLAIASGEDITPADRAKFDENFASLLKEFPESMYAAYASLQKAKLDVQAGELDKAMQSLQWVIDTNVNSDIVALANLRLAQVHFAKGESDKALALLEKDSTPFSAAYEELRGDIYLEKGDLTQSLAAYKKAKELQGKNNETPDTILDLKIASIDKNDKVGVFPMSEKTAEVNETKTESESSK